MVLKQLGKRLWIELPTAQPDIMVVLAGGKGNRVDYAASLYKKGAASRVVMSGGGVYYGTYKTQVMANYAVKKGIPVEVISQERMSLSTYEDAINTAEMLKGNNFSILLITDRYHTRRSYRVFKKAFRGRNITLNVMGAPDGIDYDQWWHHHEMMQDVLTEWAKTVVYWIKY
jgi:uncharacterized SAM-binding protein YcdF (DUF218 family)